jgi:predicted metal-dependent enzyme (double-stranded beta helix superfamily)
MTTAPGVTRPDERIRNAAPAPKYQEPQNLDQQAIHLANKERLSGAIADLRQRFFMERPQAQGREFQARLRQELPAVLERAEIDTSPYAARCDERGQPDFINGYGKFFLHGEENAGAVFCLQYFHFEPGQKTPLHDHPVACISVVARGSLRERHYDAVGEGLARKRQHRDRDIGDMATILNLDVGNIHSLKNKGSQVAASVHLYFMDGQVQHRAVKTVYKELRATDKALSHAN